MKMIARSLRCALALSMSLSLSLPCVLACTPAEEPPPADDDEDDDPDDDAPSCASYCASVTQNCTGGSAQYGSEQECLALCDAGALGWAVGTADEAGAGANTLGCRQYHAGAAANDDHCLHAGPTGGAVCGALCDAYCDAAMASCIGEHALYADGAACRASCAKMPTWGAVNAAAGDTVQCRLYHLGAAATDPATHCAHAGVSGADVCGTWCEVYCGLMATSCPGTYASAGTCSAVCAGLPDDGDIGDATGDTVQCRIFHASVAAEDMHCDHASEFSTADTCR